MKPESIRQRSPKKRTPALRDAALAELADAFPEGTRIGDGSLKDYRAWTTGEGPGRRYVIDPSDFPQLRLAAIAAICAAGDRPTRQRIADRLYVDVRTLYNYDHGLPKGSSTVAVTIEGPGFRIECRPGPPRS